MIKLGSNFISSDLSLIKNDVRRLNSVLDLVSVNSLFGFLSKIYSQTYLAYVGGGFSSNGIHNLAEPAATGNPVMFGPNFHNSNKLDALYLKKSSAGFSINSYAELIQIIDNLN